MPILFFFRIKKIRNDPLKKLRVGFIFSGLRPEYYYWEFVILLRKLTMVVIFVFMRVALVGG